MPAVRAQEGRQRDLIKFYGKNEKLTKHSCLIRASTIADALFDGVTHFAVFAVLQLYANGLEIVTYFVRQREVAIGPDFLSQLDQHVNSSAQQLIVSGRIFPDAQHGLHEADICILESF